MKCVLLSARRPRRGYRLKLVERVQASSTSVAMLLFKLHACVCAGQGGEEPRQSVKSTGAAPARRRTQRLQRQGRAGAPEQVAQRWQDRERQDREVGRQATPCSLPAVHAPARQSAAARCVKRTRLVVAAGPCGSRLLPLCCCPVFPHAAEPAAAGSGAGRGAPSWRRC